MRLTVTTLADEIFTFEVSEDMELDSFRALCEIETGISAREIVVFWNGRPLHDDRRNFYILFTYNSSVNYSDICSKVGDLTTEKRVFSWMTMQAVILRAVSKIVI